MTFNYEILIDGELALKTSDRIDALQELATFSSLNSVKKIRFKISKADIVILEVEAEDILEFLEDV